MDISGEQIWQKLIEDPKFTSKVNSKQRAVLEPFVIALPDVLASHLDEPASLQNICGCKVTAMRYCMENDFIEKWAEVYMPLVFAAKLIGKQGACNKAKAALVKLIDKLGEVSEDATGYLQRKNQSEDQYIQNLGLNPENLQKHSMGTLKISDLLLSQPTIFTDL